MKTAHEIAQANNAVDKYGVPSKETVEAMKAYAEQAIREAAEICKEHRDSGCFDGEGAEANILNLINELQ